MSEKHAAGRVPSHQSTTEDANAVIDDPFALFCEWDTALDQSTFTPLLQTDLPQ
jgi:hypothetical protein